MTWRTNILYNRSSVKRAIRDHNKGGESTMPRPQTDESEAVEYRQSGLDRKFLNLLAKRQEADQIIKDAEKAKREASQEILAMLTESGHKTVVTPDWRVTFVASTHMTINRERLLELGVPVKTIDKATKRTSYETVAVTAVKQS